MNIRILLAQTFALASITCATLSAEDSREWKNPSGTKSFAATFVSREGPNITLSKPDGNEITFSIEKLHKDDKLWLNRNHPADGSEPIPSKHAVFDTLEFGDSRSEVETKLKESKMVGTGIAGTFFGRTGLNGVYHTNAKIGGLHCYLFFDWNDSGKLKEITLQTETKKSSQYTKILRPCWNELIGLVSPIHGKPMQEMKIASPDLLSEGQMLATHLWKIETGGTVMLGTSKLNNGYQVVVRFTQEDIKPIKVES